MIAVEKVFSIDKDIAVAIDEAIDKNEQSKYVNELFAQLLHQKDCEQVENVIWHFAQEIPNANQTTTNDTITNNATTVDMLRAMRDGHYLKDGVCHG